MKDWPSGSYLSCEQLQASSGARPPPLQRWSALPVQGQQSPQPCSQPTHGLPWASSLAPSLTLPACPPRPGGTTGPALRPATHLPLPSAPLSRTPTPGSRARAQGLPTWPSRLCEAGPGGCLLEAQLSSMQPPCPWPSCLLPHVLEPGCPSTTSTASPTPAAALLFCSGVTAARTPQSQ